LSFLSVAMRLRMGFPHGHRKTTTLIAGLRIAGRPASEAQVAKNLVVQLEPTLAGRLDMPAAAAAGAAPCPPC
jgi:hypothetical protein